MKQWFKTYYPIFVIAIFLVFVGCFLRWIHNVGEVDRMAKHRTEQGCQRACDPYRVMACFTDQDITRAVCFSDDPYIANVIVVNDDMEKLEYWRESCDALRQDRRIPLGRD